MEESPRVSARAFIKQNDKILLSKYKDERGFWYVMPGGGQRKGETLKECLVREIKEEIGIDIDVRKMKCIREIIADRHEVTNLSKGFHQVEIFFECAMRDGSKPDIGQELDSGQVGYEWIELSDLQNILFFPIALAERIKNNDLEGQYLGEMR